MIDILDWMIDKVFPAFAVLLVVALGITLVAAPVTCYVEANRSPEARAAELQQMFRECRASCPDDTDAAIVPGGRYGNPTCACWPKGRKP